MPKVQINCYCCGCTSTISFVDDIIDPDTDEGEEDTSVENYPSIAQCAAIIAAKKAKTSRIDK